MEILDPENITEHGHSILTSLNLTENEQKISRVMLFSTEVRVADSSPLIAVDFD